ncbi:erythritol transport system substrate-binding protein [Pseudomonas sp. JUb42]|jgi:erythritol transport system substrate-binding protein|uniref:D-ribose ABC transporter substrate-binding protein n=1 Tax=Pseudomonas sp. JUb42 TaxID=2940611 RepID=UPI002169BE0C|nr:D-ribose ABC transporter substrate-binding protein [Pseudomonas sp. JUb42]MCS3470952.1 erythritol transport system substrate-binding protein [Pseudomonas sp. JUb42]
MKRLFSCTLLSLAVLSASLLPLAASAADFKAADHLIVIITPSHSNAFYKAESDTAEAAAKKLGYKTNALVHQDDPDIQLRLVQTAIGDNASAIILDNAGSDSSIAAVKRAQEAKIPVFLIDREVNANGIATAQIVSNNSQCATSVAEYFADQVGYKGEYVELIGRSSDVNAHVRSKGFHRVLDQIPDLKMVSQQSANWDQTQGYNVMQSIIQANPNIVGVLAGNDTMALGAAAALKNAGKSDVKVVGIDGNPDVVRQIAGDGPIIATGLQQATQMAAMAMEQADHFLRTGKSDKPEKQSVDCVMVSKDNSKQVREGGFGMR